MISEEIKDKTTTFAQKCEKWKGYTLKIHSALSSNKDNFNRHFTTFTSMEFVMTNFATRFSGSRMMFMGDKQTYEISIALIELNETNPLEFEFLEKYSETVYRKSTLTFIPMRIYKYKRCWSMEEGEAVEGELYQLLFDYPYAFPYANQETNIHTIPSIEALNQLLKSGGSHCGMSPGCTWPPFEIDQTTYQELIDTLLHLDLKTIKEEHYYAPPKLIVDYDLNAQYTDPDIWKKQHRLKYLGVHDMIEFFEDDEPTLYFNDKALGQIEILGMASGSRYFGLLKTESSISTLALLSPIKPQNLEKIKHWFSHKEHFKQKKWFQTDSDTQFEVTDSWDRQTKVLELFFCENNYLVFQTDFKEIKPQITI